MKTQTIILIGAAGAGKTVVGRALAQILDKPFFDTDDMIEAALGMAAPEIFERFGEGAFREKEAEAILCAAMAAGRCGAGAVIAVGGGAVMNEGSASALKRAGLVVWLEREASLLARNGRPLYKEAGAAERLLALRAPVYERLCDARVKNDSTVLDAAARVRTAVAADTP